MVSSPILKPEGVGVRRPQPSGLSSFPPNYLSRPSATIPDRDSLFKRPGTLLGPVQVPLPGASPSPPPPLPSPRRAGCGRQDPTFPHHPVTAIPPGRTGSPDHTHLMLGVGVAEDRGAKSLRPLRTADRSVSSHRPAHTGSSLRSAGGVVTHELRMHRPGPITAHCWAT